MAALKRKIQLTLTPPKQAERDVEERTQANSVQQENSYHKQLLESVNPDTKESSLCDSIIVVRPDILEKTKIQSKGIKF